MIMNSASVTRNAPTAQNTSVTRNASVLCIQNLSISFRVNETLVEAVKNVSIDIAAKETVALVGESGSGKSTIAAAINQLLPENSVTTSGRVFFEGQDITGLTEHKLATIRGTGIGLVPQDPMSNLNPLMRIGNQISEALKVHDYASGSAANQQAVKLLEMVGIPDAPQRARQYPHEFSGGMRQRALIAMGLACRPRLLIADEPTSALDVTVQRRILDQLDELTAEMGTAVFLISHDLSLAAERADRVMVMLRGAIVEQGSAKAVLENPSHEYTKRLVSAAPSLSSKYVSRPVLTTTRGADALDAIGRTGSAGLTGAGATDAGATDAGLTGTNTPLVSVKNLRKEFELRSAKAGKTKTFVALDGVSFDLVRGQTVSIVGESGSGKSTTANLILGLDTVSSGSIQFNGTDLATLRKKELLAFRRRVQPVFQNPYAALNPRFSVEKSIAEPLKVHQIGNTSSRRQRVVELLTQVALTSTMANRLPHELSGGQRQRVAIARALALSPELVILDEAVSALDVLVQAQILELLNSLQSQLGLSYLFISHDLAVVRSISDTVHVMQHGRIVESGTPSEIFDSPKNPYTKELLASIPGATHRK